MALLVVGYFLVGPFVPRILGMREPIKPAAPKAFEVVSDEPTYGEPEVDISAAPAGRSYSTTRSSNQPRRRRHTTPKAPPKEQAPVEEPPVDEPPVDDPPVVDPPPTTGGTTGDSSTTGG